MAHLAEPHDAAPGEGELASLVRRWVGARRSGAVRVAQVPAPAPDDPLDRDPVVAVPAPAPAPMPEATAEPAVVPTTEPAAATPARAPRIPALPHRPSSEDPEHATRLAVLIDARRVPEDVAAGLLTRLGDRGSVNVCRAYADWRRADLGTWVERLRRQGLHSFHQFADGDDQALVALAIDAVDIAREASVDEVVLAGDMTSMLPLVHRLHGAGVRVVVVGPGHTPHDVRAACDEFLDEDSLLGEPAAPAGRHRA
ncbi:NYN domain-containing protein [Nocardioides eburneiflavus]|uniref:NYN domain-containing protein n=1 Tax=Nocardioides eburneiflavus TaxID=2518372 RepID=A0A4Z1C118_9ACTN|nr:NYN domain-containing protein [Nocardioides eburneiflavus]TGN63854.1 NYN domain-containing protein [Nocardioides eburneiflavus]